MFLASRKVSLIPVTKSKANLKLLVDKLRQNKADIARINNKPLCLLNPETALFS